MKLHLCCGANYIEGWHNQDMECDITKPLPYPNGSVAFVFCEHGIEHTTHQQAWRFFEECFRVLQPGGVVRIAIPDLVRMSKFMTQEYADAVKKGGHGDGSFQSALKACVFQHGHQAAWTAHLLSTFLYAVGFKTTLCHVGHSKHPELRGIEGHGKVVGDDIAEVETSVCEGVKP